MPNAPSNLREFNSLLKVVEALRGPEGCPWDKMQNHSTLTQYAIEEAHELAEAIDKGSQAEIIEELGDLLLQVVLHAEIARQENRFNISDIIESISSKMIRRHPHVFADVNVENADEVMVNWQKIKDSEKVKKSQFFDMPTELPALIRSQKMGQKTKKYNFDWNSISEVMAKVDEELAELKEALQSKSKEAQQHELGDLLFSLAQLARHLDFDSEQALRKTNLRFEERFNKMSELAQAKNWDFSQLSSEQLEELWTQAKKNLSKRSPE